MAKFYIIGLGSKARQGKDTFANYVTENYPNVYVLHFADCLYEECRNSKREVPLIKWEYERVDNDIYAFLDHDTEYKYFTKKDMPEIHDLFKKRHISRYEGMNEKDGEILQIWGTQFRRNNFGDNYWINRTDEKVKEVMKKYEGTNDSVIVYILLPDTRFKNEAEYIRSFGPNGIFIKIERYNNDGTRFIAPDRDPKHQSETDLDSTDADFYISSKTLDELKEYTLEYIKTLK